MNGFAQNLMAAPNPGMQGTFGGNSSLGPAGGYAPGTNMFDPFGANSTMNAIGGQHAQMTAMFSQMTNAIMMMTQMFMLKSMQSMVSSMGNFGGGASGGGSGVSDFLGGSSAGGGSSVGESSGAAATSSDVGNVAGWGKDLAKHAENNANGPGGYCFKWVAQALRKFGVNTSGASAYMAADQLAKNPKFREVKIDGKELAKLPAGAVVVWNRGNGHQHGHISISLGDGREASDKIRKQTTTSYGTSFRVFLPK